MLKSLFVILCLGVCFMTSDVSWAQVNAGSRGEYFALMDPRDSETDYESFLALADVDGIAVRTSWDMLEPQDNQYDWTSIDGAFDAAKKYNKKVTLHIVASSYATPPLWLKSQGAKFYNESNPFQPHMPAKDQAIPWDKIYLEKWAEFLPALSSHLKKSGYEENLSRLSVAVPVPEMSLIGCRDGRMANSIPYSRASYLWAWQYGAYAMNAAFPNMIKLISAPVDQICMPDKDGARFYGDVMSYVKTLGIDKFHIYAADLNAQGSGRLKNLGDAYRQYPVDFQFIWSFSNDPRNRFQGTLRDSICKAYKEYGAKYFEVYKADIRNADNIVQRELGLIHRLDECR